jgi:hypothetical protein
MSRIGCLTKASSPFWASITGSSKQRPGCWGVHVCHQSSQSPAYHEAPRESRANDATTRKRLSGSELSRSRHLPNSPVATGGGQPLVRASVRRSSPAAPTCSKHRPHARSWSRRRTDRILICRWRTARSPRRRPPGSPNACWVRKEGAQGHTIPLGTLCCAFATSSDSRSAPAE